MEHGIKLRSQVIDHFENCPEDRPVRLAVRTFTSACIVRCTVATNGYGGGDSGHGGCVVLSLENLASTDLEVAVDGKWVANAHEFGRVDLVFGGDCEIDTLVDALQFAAAELDRMLRSEPRGVV